ncbi:MAG: CBS domain-containing protein [Candidatus Methanomethyliaceae archaeon]|nr:CBS domain-containing protein [Candidatus Methanomethyliaceae archaeon]
MNKTLNKIIRRKLVWINPEASIKDAAELMQKEEVSSVVIMKDDVPIGIITDSDLRRVVAEGWNFSTKLYDFLEHKPRKFPNLITADINENQYNVLSRMLEHRIKHTIVMDSGRPIGVATIGDLAYGLTPFHIHYIIKLRKAKSLEEIKQIISEFKADLIKNVMEFSKSEVKSFKYFFESISSVIDNAIKVIAELRSIPSKNFVYVLTGSWGRKEQFLLTDRDTFAIYKENQINTIEFINDFEDCLDEIGFPPCQHGYTARNFTFEFNDLIKLIDDWGSDPNKFVVNLSLIADARAIIGEGELLEKIKEKLINKLYKNRLFILQSLSYRPPESFFGLPKSFNLKSKLIAPLEYPIRALAITNKILATSTMDRISLLKEENLISEDLYQSLIQAYNIAIRFKILIQTKSKNQIETSSLTYTERELLKNAIRTIKFFHKYIERSFV